MISQDFCNELLRIGNPCEPHFGYFDINGHTLRVTSAAREMIDSLRSFFYPYITNWNGTSCASRFCELAAIVDPGLYDYLEANLPETPDNVLTTALKHDLEYQLRCFYSESKEITIIEDQPLNLFYVVSDHGRSTKLIATNRSRTRTGLLRVIRSAWVLSYEALIVHGCALEKHGRGIIIAGEKHAGKTTSLLNLCSRRDYDIVANDRLLLDFNQSNERLRAIGVPTVINLRRNTVKPFPELQHLINVPLFGVRDLAEALNVDVKREVEVTAIAFLSYDDDCSKPAFRSLSREESYEMVAPHLFSGREYDWVRTMKIGDIARDRAGLTKRSILNDVACYQLSSNESQLEDVAALLDNWCQLGSIRG